MIWGPARPGIVTDSRWFDDWMRAWQSFSGAGASVPWAAALEHFTKTHQAAYQPPLADALYKLTEQSRAFFELGQQISGIDREGWRESVLEYLDTLAEQAKDPRSAARAFAGASPLDYWQQFTGHDGSPSRDRPSFLSEVEQTLQIPGLGYTREHQESVQELSRRWLEYEKAHGEYAAYCAETARRSVEKLRGRLQEAFDANRGPASVRSLYDTWVACAEEIYAERAATREYVQLHGRMVNTFLAYKQQAGRIIDQWADAMNLPTREEVDSLHRKLTEMRRDLRDLEGRLAAREPVRG